MKRVSHRQAFTLIELLVVISIIALLISILLPALQSAKYRMRVLHCMTNLQQLGVGFSTYAADDPNYKYPTPNAISLATVYVPPGDGWWMGSDNRQGLYQIGGEAATDIWLCPFYEISAKDSTLEELPYSNMFLVNKQRHYGVRYVMFVLARRDHPWDWSNSSNPDIDGDGVRDGPYTPGDSDSCIMADYSGSDPSKGLGTYQRPWVQAHNGPHHSGGPPLRETNSLYGDGHVVSRGTLKYRVFRGITTDSELY